jgi:hypothetical protein
MRISTTTLESFRLFVQPDQEWMTEDELLATIRGEFRGSPAVALGQAFGRVLEDPDCYQVPGGYRCNGYSFSEATVAPGLALIDRRGVFEAKAAKAYGSCEVVAKADHLLGAHLTEFKTTSGTFDFDKYAASCQWRFMVDIFEPLQVTYHVFRLDDHDNGVAELRGIETFNLFPYAGLHEDCCDLLWRFTDYVTAKGLDGLLRDRQKAAA